MGRSPCCEREGLNRGAWTALEDKILTDYIKAHGEGRWRNVPKKAGLKRCGKSCRLRWLNYLRPDIKRGNITRDEEDLIIRLHKLLGNRWSLIAGRLPGRTDNEIKNYWNTNVGKKIQPSTTPSPPAPPISMQRPTAPRPTYPKNGIDYRSSTHPKLAEARPLRAEPLGRGGRSALIELPQQQQQQQGSPQDAAMKVPAVVVEHSPWASQPVVVECEKAAAAVGQEDTEMKVPAVVVEHFQWASQPVAVEYEKAVAAVGQEFPSPNFEDIFVPPSDDDLWMINCLDHPTVDDHLLSSDYSYFLEDADFGHHHQPCGFEYREAKSGAATPKHTMHGDEEGPQSPNLEMVEPFLEAELDCWLS